MPHLAATRRRVLVVLLLVAVAAGTAGCNAIDRGDQLASQFEAWMRDADHVEHVDAGGRNLFPFSGTGRATVTVADDVRWDRLRAVVDRVNAFPAREVVTVTLEHEVAGVPVAFEVPPGPAGTVAATLDAVLAVATVPDVVSLDLARTDDLDAVLGATVVTEGDVPTAVDDVSPLLLDEALGLELLTVTDTSAGVVATFADPAQIDGPRAALDAIAAAHPVLGAELTDGALAVRVDAPRGTDVAALARAAAPGVDVSVQYGIVTADDLGDDGRVEAVIAAAEGTGLALAIEADPEHVEVVVADVPDALAVDAVLRSLPEARGLDLFYATGDDVVWLTAGPRTLRAFAAALTALDELRAAGVVVDLHAWDGGIRIDATADPTPEDAASLGRALALLPDGVDVGLVLGTAGADLRTGPGDAADALEPRDPRDAGDPLLDALARGWDEARAAG